MRRPCEIHTEKALLGPREYDSMYLRPDHSLLILDKDALPATQGVIGHTKTSPGLSEVFGGCTEGHGNLTLGKEPMNELCQ